MSILNNIVWQEKYRPLVIEDCILPKDVKIQLLSMIENNAIPNMLLSGPAGTGKTTTARALCNELNYEVLMINGSNEGRIFDTLRNKITNFASQISLSGQNKCVIIDEADYLPQETIQPALRNFIDEFSKSDVKFIFTCNYPNKIIEPLQSRCACIDFQIPKDESLKLMADAIKRIKFILDSENITITNDTILIKLIKKYFPDLRRLINELQFKTANGTLDSSALTGVINSEFKELVGYLANRDGANIRKWVAEQPYLSIEDIAHDLYANMTKICSNEDSPQFIITLADWQYKSSFMPDKELAVAAMLVELIMNIDIKGL